MDTIKRVYSTAATEEKALQEIAQALFIAPAKYALIVLFVSPEYSVKKIRSQFQQLFAEQPLIACSTAGEITPEGYLQHSISGFALPQAHFRAEVLGIEQLNTKTPEQIAAQTGAARELLQKQSRKPLDNSNSFVLLLSDGLSMAEEKLASGVQLGSGNLPMLGGSAGDGTRFEKTWVYCHQKLSENCAVVAMVFSDYVFRVFKAEHFVRNTDSAYVVTEADAEKRIVWEIDALPATEAYARIMGVDVAELSTDIFASHPVAVRLDGKIYIRSVQKVVAGGGLQFYCAIERGMVLYRVEKTNMLQNLQQKLKAISRELGEPEMVIGCDCILRQFEAKKEHTLEAVGQVMKKNKIIGFSTYGEQVNGVHLNQTFTGLALVAPE